MNLQHECDHWIDAMEDDIMKTFKEKSNEN